MRCQVCYEHLPLRILLEQLLLSNRTCSSPPAPARSILARRFVCREAIGGIAPLGVSPSYTPSSPDDVLALVGDMAGVLRLASGPHPTVPMVEGLYIGVVFFPGLVRFILDSRLPERRPRCVHAVAQLCVRLAHYTRGQSAGRGAVARYYGKGRCSVALALGLCVTGMLERPPIAAGRSGR